MDEKIKALTDAVKNKENKTTPDKITAINTALSTLIVDNKFSVPNKEKAGENIEKTFDASTTNDDIKILIENFIKDEKDITKQNQYKLDLLAALQGARDSLKTLANVAQIRQAIENETTQTSDSRSDLATEVKDNMHIYSTQELAKFVEAGEESSKSRKELWSTPGYIRTIQSLILELGAQDPSIDKKKLEDGIYGEATRAGILTIQKILNKPPYNESKNLVEDGKPGPYTLGALLYPIDGKTTWDKLIEDKKVGKLTITPELVQKKVDQNTKTTKKQGEKKPTQSVTEKDITQQSNSKKETADGKNINNEIKLENNTAKWIKSINDLPKDKNGDFKRDKKLNISYLYKKDGIRYRFFDTGRATIFNEKTSHSDKQNSKDILNILKNNIPNTPIEKNLANEQVRDILFRGLKRQENEIKQKVENSLKEHGLGQWKVTGFKHNNGLVDVLIASTYNLNQHITIATLGKIDIETQTDHINNDNIANIIIKGIEKHNNKIIINNKKLQEKIQKETADKEKLKKLQIEIQPKIRGKKYTISDIYGIGNSKTTNYKYTEFFRTFSSNTLEIDKESGWVVDQNTVRFGFNQYGFDKDFVKNLTCNTQDIISNGKFDENKFKNILGKIIDKLIVDHYSS